MTSQTTQYPCFCTFVPPHILEHMAKSSEEVVGESVREAARLSMMQDNQIRLNRGNQGVDMATLAGGPQGVMAPLAGTAGREVYNCFHQWSQSASSAVFPSMACWITVPKTSDIDSFNAPD